MIPFQDTRTSGRFPFQTAVLIAITAYVFYHQLTAADPDAFIYQYSLIPALVDFSQPATLLPFFSSIFLHGGFLHIAGNMLFLWVFGDNIEERLGFLYVPFYLIGGAAAGLAQYYFMAGSDIPVLGASGAVAAVLGAYFVMYPHHRVKTLIPIFFFLTVVTLPAWVLLAYWFGLQLFNGYASLGADTASGGVAYAAHVGGFLFGAVSGALIGRGASYRQPSIDEGDYS